MGAKSAGLLLEGRGVAGSCSLGHSEGPPQGARVRMTVIHVLVATARRGQQVV